MATDETTKALEAVADERVRQRAKWGVQVLPNGTGGPGARAVAEWARQDCQSAAAAGRVTWADVLEEEVAEAFAESDPVRLRAELVQVAAVAVQWIEALDADAGVRS